IGSTGSPLPPEGFSWVYQEVGSDLLLGSFSGGTDLCTGFVGPNPLLPVRAGIIAGRCLGAEVEAYNEQGKPDTGQLGRPGRLVLYVVLAPGRDLDDELVGRLRAALRSELSPRHVPDEIHQVPGV